MGHCIYYKAGVCTNKVKCPWGNKKGKVQECTCHGLLARDKLSGKDKLGVGSRPSYLQDV